jgi:transposase
MKVTTIGIDLAKDVFGLHGVDGKGRVAFKKRLVRSRLLEFMSQLPPCLVGPGSLQQRTLLGAQDRAVRSSSKTYESAVCKTLPEKR